MKPLLNYRQASEILNVKVSTLYGWVCRKKINFRRLSGRTIRFDPVELEDWLNGRRNLSVEAGRHMPAKDDGADQDDGAE